MLELKMDSRPRRQAAVRLQQFAQELPHREGDFASRAWGHPLHSLCSYQGKLKPALAHWLVKAFSNHGDRVLDPLGGVGTIALEACLQGRQGISNDLSPLAATIAGAKVRPPSVESCSDAIDKLAAYMGSSKVTSKDREAAQFGLNSAVTDYYHPDTLEEVLKSRRFFLERENLGPGDEAMTFVRASILHILHGNRPYALSRTSHPITPFRPKGPALYKSLVEKLRQRCRILEGADFEAFEPGTNFHGDFRGLATRIKDVDSVITSPPFFRMRFDRPNWLRLWYCGWEAKDFHEASRAFLERQQVEDLTVYREFFGAMASVMRPHGTLVLHLGGSGKYEMAKPLIQLASPLFKLDGHVVEDVANLEKHGVKDKGVTSRHEYLAFTKAA
jgi:hypothetical protein